jgi:hypothetical protein
MLTATENSKAVREVMDHYSSTSCRSRHTRIGPNKSGIFLPTDLDDADYVMRSLIDKRLISREQKLLDAGCGDGRIVALASANGFDSLGIEGDKRICRRAERHIQTLKNREVLAPERACVVLGDFTTDEPYNNSGRRFEDFGLLFNFHNGHRELADMVSSKSPTGTMLLLAILQESPIDSRGLRLVYKIPTMSMEGAVYFQLYEKTA